MTTLTQDMVELNFHFLTLARNLVRTEPLQALWILDITEDQADIIANMTVLEMQEIARSGRSIMSLSWL